MNVQCPHPGCGGRLDIVRTMFEHTPCIVIRGVCPQCGKRIDNLASLFSAGAPDFPLLAADERWRNETCGKCAFRIGGLCRRAPAIPDGYRRVAACVNACVEWRERK